MGRVLVLTLRMLRGLAAERTLRERAERERTEREHAEAAYRRLVERLPAIVYRAEVGEFGAWTYVSPQIESILGFSPEEWCADPTLWEQRLHPEDRERAIADEHAAARGRQVGSTDYRMLARNGRVVWFADDAVLEQDDRGPPALARRPLRHQRPQARRGGARACAPRSRRRSRGWGRARSRARSWPA